MSGLAVNFLVAVLAIVNPVGKIPIWTRAAAGEDRGTEVWLAVLVMVTSGAILLLALLFGTHVLSAFNIDLPSFQVAGGILIFIIGLDMIRGQAARVDSDEKQAERTPLANAKTRFRKIMVPVAIPIMAGPGSITTVIIFGARAQEWPDRFLLAGLLGAVLVTIFVSLLLARYVKRLVGETSLDVVTRLFGLILTAIAVQIAASGLGLLFPVFVTSESPIWDEVQKTAVAVEDAAINDEESRSTLMSVDDDAGGDEGSEAASE